VRRCDLGAWLSKNTGQQKSHKSVIFPLFGGSPRLIDSTQKLHGGWCPRHNHVCQVSYWNLHGLRFYRASNFRFSYWFLHGPYNSAALMRCLWCAACDIITIIRRNLLNIVLLLQLIHWTSAGHIVPAIFKSDPVVHVSLLWYDLINNELISRWDRRTLLGSSNYRLEPRHSNNCCHSYNRVIGESWLFS